MAVLSAHGRVKGNAAPEPGGGMVEYNVASGVLYKWWC